MNCLSHFFAPPKGLSILLACFIFCCSCGNNDSAYMTSDQQDQTEETDKNGTESMDPPSETMSTLKANEMM